MALKTTTEQLEEVQAAISAVMTSQEMATGPNARLVRARLSELHAREEVLLGRLNRENRRTLSTVGTMRRD